MSKKIEKGSDSLSKTNKIVWIIAGVLTIFLTIYTFFVIYDMRNLVP